MIKGINRHMIEIVDTNNEYYDKAFLVVKAKYENMQNDFLEKEAKNMLRLFGTPSAVSKKKKNKFLYWFIRLFPVVIASVAATILVIHTLNL